MALLASCVSKKKFGQLMNDKDAIDQMLADQQEKVANLESDLSTLQEEKTKLEENFNTETTRLNSELSKVQTDLKTSQDEIAQVRKSAEEKEQALKTVRETMGNSFDVYAKSGLNVVNKNNSLYVDMAAPIRYRSGSTRISEEAKPILAEMAEKLIANPSIRVLVEGHTDSVPMKEGAVYSDNMALSVARAKRVVKELVKLGVSPDQLSSIGRGESMPSMMEESDTEDVQSSNRRTEFVLMPEVGNLYDLNHGDDTGSMMQEAGGTN